MSDSAPDGSPAPEKPKPVIIKDAVIGSQAERLVKVHREITKADQMTRMEQIESEARAKANAISAQIKAQADEMLANARNESETIRRNAREEGDLNAKREALERVAELIQSLENEIHGLREIRADFMKENLHGILDFACSLAEKIIVCELRTRPELVAQRAQAILNKMPPGAPVTMTVSPDDLDVIERYIQEAGGPADTLRPALSSDPAIPKGAVRVESDLGTIEARLLDELRKFGDILGSQAEQETGTHPETGEASDVS